MFIDIKNLTRGLLKFKNNTPFDHCVIDNFFNFDIAKGLEAEFIDYDDKRWFCYSNPLEDKKALNDWNAFPSLTYKVFRELISGEFINILTESIGVSLFQDPGLHGGGWHIHGQGGNLNPHYDYSIHPKVGLQRKVNIIIYLASDLDENHGGHLGLWSHDAASNSPGELVQVVQPRFNRAVIFDTTQNSWHGICKPLTQPEGVYRKSLAVYYLTTPDDNADPRQRALFAAREEQKGNSEVENLILTRSDSSAYSSVYRVK